MTFFTLSFQIKTDVLIKVTTVRHFKLQQHALRAYDPVTKEAKIKSLLKLLQEEVTII